MSIQIYSYGGFIRLVTDSSVLLHAKTQVKSVEAVRDDSVKISLGEGPGKMHYNVSNSNAHTQHLGYTSANNIKQAVKSFDKRYF
jgi:hypothetical protein